MVLRQWKRPLTFFPRPLGDTFCKSEGLLQSGTHILSYCDDYFAMKLCPPIRMSRYRTYFTDFRGGFNGSTQHPSRTRLALKTKAKSLARVRPAGTLPWLGFDRGQPNRSLLPGKHCRINALDGVASTG